MQLGNFALYNNSLGVIVKIEETIIGNIVTFFDLETDQIYRLRESHIKQYVRRKKGSKPADSMSDAQKKAIRAIESNLNIEFNGRSLDDVSMFNYELEFNSRPYDKERANAILFLRYYSDETAIMLEFVKLYVQMQQALVHTINTNIGFLMESNPVPRVYTTLETLVEYLAKYRVVVTDTETFLYRFNSFQPIELI